jgi:uncharacterized membrane protein YfcA
MLLLSFLILGAIAGLLAGLFGIGGGVIIIPGLIYLFESTHIIPSHALMQVALGSSLASVVFTSTVAMIIHSRQNNILWPIARKLIPGLLVGAIIGSYATSQLNTQWLMVLFAGFLGILSLRFIFNWRSNITYPFPATPVMWGVGVFIGSLTSMLGLGGGVLIIPFLSCLPLQMREVSALSIVCILPVALFATLGYIIFGFNTPDLPKFTTGYVYWPAVLPIILASSVFAPIGISLAKHLSTQTLKKIFGVLLLCISISLFILD